MRTLFALLFCFSVYAAFSQRGAAFTQISSEDGLGLASNVIYSLHQDKKGFIWVGTANGLQRFDGSKFVNFSIDKPGSDPLPQASISQILPVDSGKFLLAISSLREFGFFDPATFCYKRVQLKNKRPIPAKSLFWIWKISDNRIFLSISGYGMLGYDKATNSFTDTDPFKMPRGWIPACQGVFEDTITQRYWIAADSGLCIFDKASKKLWYRNYNPAHIPALTNPAIQGHVDKVYIDRERRLWTIGWAKNMQYIFCMDSSGANMLTNDTLGLHTGPKGYIEYGHFYEPAKSGLWIYGSGVLFNWDENQQRFLFTKSSLHQDDLNISYEIVFQLMEDRDGNLWLATDKGLFFTPLSRGNAGVVNLIFGNEKNTTSITDILEIPNGDIWFASWGEGVRSVDKYFRPVPNDVYATAFPKDFPDSIKGVTKLTWALCTEPATGFIWIGCNDGVLMIHDPVKKTTQYLRPAACNNRTIRYISSDHEGNMWLGTQGGRLIRYRKGNFEVIQDFAGSIIYKIFPDKQHLLWLATQEEGLYCVDPNSGKVMKHYTAGTGPENIFANTASDIEQLNDSIIIYGGGVLNFINKRTGKVRLLKYEDGLPSNNVLRLRMDKAGFLWIVTSNGLCRYNPNNNRITPYGRRDGVLLGDQANVADYACANGEIIFGGSNAVVMFNPSVFLNNQPPPDVTITDFQLFSKFIPVDSLQQAPIVKLLHNQNSFTIYFASLSYTQRDKLTYYYKMEGLDDEWIKADRGYFVNYSLLPPGKYSFKVYCENLEGIRSLNTTEMVIYIKPPFWRTWWFRSSILFLMALVVYDLHNSRVKRLLAVEKLRNKVARDLHDDMGSTLSTINILSSMAKTKMNSDPLKTSEYLGRISDNSQRMMEAMDDIVWSIKPSNDSMSKVMARMREFATSVLEAKEIDLSFIVDDRVYDEKLNMEARRDFFLIFKEAVNNAAKYSNASKVDIHISVFQKQLVLTVKDNGSGFVVAKADSGNGLGNMQKRAEAMRGNLRIDSAPGQGTAVTLRVPV